MSIFRYIVLATIAVLAVPATQAKARCPGGLPSIRPRFAEQAIPIIPVTVNDSGPWDFVLDTAAEVTTVDPALAEELHFKPEGTRTVIGAGFSAQAAYARAEWVRAGAHAIHRLLVFVQPLGQIQISDRRVRGILGQNFLEQYDLLIDYIHGLVCLDDSGKLRANISGEHIALAAPENSEGELPFTRPLILPVTGISERPLRLQLDSGINAPLLFDAMWVNSLPLGGAVVSARGTDSRSRDYAALPPRDIQVGRHRLRQISFFVSTHPNGETPHTGIDGVLPAGLFGSFFVSARDGFAVLVPR